MLYPVVIELIVVKSKYLCKPDKMPRSVFKNKLAIKFETQGD